MSQTAGAPFRAAPAPLALNLENIPCTSTAPQTTQVTYRKLAQPSGEQVKPPKLIPPATYKRDSTKASKMARVVHAESSDAGTDPKTDVSSIDSFARGTSTTGDENSAATSMTTKSDYHTALTSVITNLRRPTFTKIIQGPVATSTQ